MLKNMADGDKQHAFMSVQLKGDNDDAILNNYNKNVGEDGKTVKEALNIDGVDVQQAGLQPLASELTGTIGEDQKRAEVAAIPLVCVVLFFVFGGVVAAALPGLIGGLTIAGALGIMRLIAEFIPVHFFAQPVVTLMGLGIAVDYGLFMVSRFREEIAEGYDTEAAVRRTVMTSGRTIMFSAVILVASSVPLLLFPQGFLKSITYAIIASVMLAAILSITVLAAALAILGPNVDALGVRTLLRVPFFRNWKPMRVYLTWLADKTQKTKTRAEVEKGFWGKLVNRVMKRPIAFAAPIVIIMIIFIIPLGQLALGGISEKYLPPDNSVRQAQEEFDKIFPGFRTEPLTIVMESDNGQPVTDQQIAEIRNKAMQIPGFIEPENDTANMWKERPYLDGASESPSVRVIQNGLVNRNDAATQIEELRAIPPPRGVTVSIGGTPALEQDSIHSLFDKLPMMVLLLITTTTILMFLAFGSVVLPIKAALMSALTLGSTMGDPHVDVRRRTRLRPDELHAAAVDGTDDRTDHRGDLGSVDRLRGVPGVSHGGGPRTRHVHRRSHPHRHRHHRPADHRCCPRPGRRRRRVRVLRSGDDEVPGLRPAPCAAAGRHDHPNVPGARDHEAARRRLLVGAEVDEAASGPTRPRRDRTARRTQASRGARTGRGVGRCGCACRAAAPPAPRPDASGRRGCIAPRCDHAHRDATAGQRTVGCGHDADPHLCSDEPQTTRMSIAKNAVRNVVSNAAAATQRAARPPAPRPQAPREEREIESWLGELRGTGAPAGQPTPPPAKGTSPEGRGRPSADATRAMPEQGARQPRPRPGNAPATAIPDARAPAGCRRDDGHSHTAAKGSGSHGEDQHP